MGSALSLALAVETIIRRLKESRLPDDREIALDCIEILTFKANSSLFRERTMEAMSLHGGVEVLLFVMQKMIKDDAVMQLSLGLFKYLLPYKEITAKFMSVGGISTLEQIQKLHCMDEGLQSEVASLLTIIGDVGADAAKQEIIAEMEHLQLCEACRQRLYEQRKLRAEDAGPGKESLTSLQRINKILGLMEMYPKKAHVQMSGVEAIADFAAHAGKTVALHNTSLPQHLAAVLENFSHSSDMVWRVCRAITNICAQEPLARALEVVHVPRLLAQIFTRFKGEPRVQQQIIWSIAGLAEHVELFELFKQDNPIMALAHTFTPQANTEHQGNATQLTSAHPRSLFLSTITGKPPYDTRNLLGGKFVIPVTLRRLAAYTVPIGLDVVPPSAPALAGNDNVESQLRRRLAERKALVKYKYGTSADLLDDGKRGLI